MTVNQKLEHSGLHSWWIWSHNYGWKRRK